MRKKSMIAICLAFCLAVPSWALSLPEQVIPGGHTIGVKLQADGLWVVGVTPVTTAEGDIEPAGQAGLVQGDMITHMNDNEIKSIEDFSDFAEQLDDHAVTIRYLRGGESAQTKLQPVLCQKENKYKMGLWVRDSMAGIGTMTFFDPDSGLFGSLGHGISDSSTGELIPLGSGYVVYSEVESVQPGQAGYPGELRGSFRTDRAYGDILENTHSGLYGLLRDREILGPHPAECIPVGTADEVTTGPAVIYSNVEGDKVGEYAIEIQKIYGPEHDSRNFMIRITDPGLLEQTGGIVQGMSGSPIIQNGKLIGAVTHVLVNDPQRGYGIYIETMLREGGQALDTHQKAA